MVCVTTENELIKHLSSNWQVKNAKNIPVDDFQKFLDRFDNFFLNCEGVRGNATALLKVCPPGKDLLFDKIILAIFKNGTWIGLVDLIRDYHKNRTWTIGYYLILSEYRNQGIGKNFLKDLADSISKEEGEKLRCVVQEQNPKALRFWTQAGFTVDKINSISENEIDRKQYILELVLDEIQ